MESFVKSKTFNKIKEVCNIILICIGVVLCNADVINKEVIAGIVLLILGGILWVYNTDE